MSKRGNGEGGIYQRKSDGKWCAALLLPDGKKRVLYGRTRAEAKDKLHTAQEDVKQARPVAANRETLAAFLDRWLKGAAAKRVRATTLRRYEMDVRLHIVPALGKLKLPDVTPKAVQAMLDGLSAKGLAPLSVRNVRAALRVALEQAIRERLFGINNAKSVDLPRAARKRVVALTPDAARAILSAFNGHPYEALVTLALATGLRQGELLGLRWEDIDLEAGTARVDGQLQRIGGAYTLTDLKTNQSRRTLPLPAVAVEAIRRQRVRQAEARLYAGPAWREPLPGLMFTTATGTPLHSTTVTHLYQKQLACAGLPRMTFHELRHGSASLLLAQGATMRTVMEALGHSQISLTMNTYSHVLPALQREAANKMEAVLAISSN